MPAKEYEIDCPDPTCETTLTIELSEEEQTGELDLTCPECQEEFTCEVQADGTLKLVAEDDAEEEEEDEEEEDEEEEDEETDEDEDED